MTTIQQGQAYDALPRIAHALTGIADSLRSIDGHLNRIANLSEADELRQRRFEEQDREAQQGAVTLPEALGLCYIEDCQHPAVVTINSQPVCSEHLEVAFQQARASFTVLRSVIAPEEEN